MGNVSELPSDLDCIFSLFRAEKVDGTVDVGGSELGWVPPKIPCSPWTVLRHDPNGGGDAAVSLWCIWSD